MELAGPGRPPPKTQIRDIPGADVRKPHTAPPRPPCNHCYISLNSACVCTTGKCGRRDEPGRPPRGGQRPPRTADLPAPSPARFPGPSAPHVPSSLPPDSLCTGGGSGVRAGGEAAEDKAHPRSGHGYPRTPAAHPWGPAQGHSKLAL